MKITVDNFELRLDIKKVDHFEYEDECNNPDIDQFTVQVRYILNGEEIGAHGSFYTIRDMVTHGITNLNKMYSSFELCPYQMEIFTCTCGQAGCAGLHYPIAVKERRHTIEWRVPKDKCPAYAFLSNTFYQFATPMVYKEMRRVVKEFDAFVKEHPTAELDVI